MEASGPNLVPLTTGESHTQSMIFLGMESISHCVNTYCLSHILIDVEKSHDLLPESWRLDEVWLIHSETEGLGTREPLL
jgi:hypothetical protein